MVNIKKEGDNKNNIRVQQATWLILVIIIVILMNIISSYFFYRIDLTTDKRYTLSPSTKEILKEVEEPVFIKIYLDGELPIAFTKFQRSIRELLDEFRVYANKNIEYEFINPYETASEQARRDLFQYLYDIGLQPTTIQDRDEEGEISQKLVFPGAVIVFGNTEVAVNLLSNNPGLSAEMNLNNSTQMLEYQLMSRIKSLTSETIEKIAFIEGHDELNEFEVADITKALSHFYQVDRGEINGQPGILDDYKAIIIAKPRREFNEKDKLVIDQYIMDGGKVLWFLDAVSVNMDSLVNGTTMAFINDLNLNDQLFRYGIRINPNLIQDIQCNIIPVNTAVVGANAKWTPAPWLYYPLLNTNNNHPVTANLNMVKSEFISEIDTVGSSPGIAKSVLLFSSPYSKTLNVPKFISLEEIKNNPVKTEFNKSHIPVAILLEGQFNSVFKNRLISNIIETDTFQLKKKSKPTKMIIVSDGDMIKNDVKYTAKGNMISPLGYDKYTQQTFGNKQFILNAINYLTDETSLIKLRSREFKLRLLDKKMIHEKRLFWQLINTIAPIFFIILFGLLYNNYRKNKYRNNISGQTGT